MSTDAKLPNRVPKMKREVRKKGVIEE